MTEQIKISGILAGIKEMLVFKDKDTLKLLKTRMECARSMLEEIIKELEPPIVTKTDISPSVTATSDPEATQAKKELS